MIQAYKDKRDLYATIAAGVYHNDYWDNQEFYEDGRPNPEGDKRRTSVKSVLLGLLYGRGIPSIAEQLNITVQEAQKVSDDFFNSFPAVQKWMDESIHMAKTKGYVTDLWGRRRRLPDIQLPRFTVKEVNPKATTNPLLHCKGIIKNELNPNIAKYEKKLENCKGKSQVEAVVSEALKDGIRIINNGAFIAQAERQTVNARIQGRIAALPL